MNTLESTYYTREMESDNLVDKAYQRVKEKIMKNELRQGEATSISSLAKELDISRTPVTSACQRLEYEGFLHVVPKQGLVVKSLSYSEANELYEMRAALETYAAKRAFDNITARDMEYLENCYQQQASTIVKNDSYRFMNEDHAFHMYIVNKCRNFHIVQSYTNIYERTFFLGIQNCSSERRISECLDEHRQILHSLTTHNKEDFIKNTEIHVLNCLTSLINTYTI